MNRTAVKTPAAKAKTRSKGRQRQQAGPKPAAARPAGPALLQNPLAPANILQLQRLTGNGSVQRLMQRGVGLQRCNGDENCTCPKCSAKRAAQPAAGPADEAVQRKIGDGHDLTAAPIAGDLRLEDAYDGVTSKYLRYGSKGEAVRKVQSALLQLGHELPKYGPDGDYGGETKAAIVDFQGSKGIGDDGIVGPDTLTELDKALGGTPKPTPLPGTQPVAGPDDFKIDHIKDSDTDQIFFGRDSSTPAGDALTAIGDIKKAAPASVSLVGYASGDEDGKLALLRAQEVAARLGVAPDSVTVDKVEGNPEATQTSGDYANARQVEVLLGSAKPETIDCDAKHDSGKDKGKPINPATQPCPDMDADTETAFNTALPIANDAMSRAVAAVNPADATFNPDLIDKFFGNHDAPTLATLLTNMTNLKNHVNILPSQTQCGGQCDRGGCERGPIAYMSGMDAAATMTLCVPTFKGLHENDAARNLIHESAHGTSPLGGKPGEGTEDVAYRHERMMLHLSPEDRLRNSDSYALFALYVRETQDKKDPDAIPEGISTPSEDDLLNFKDQGEKDAMNLAMAQLEKRLTWCRTYVGQLYGEALEVKQKKQTWAESWADNLMRQVAARFPATSPPIRPTQDDLNLIAALNDRYGHMYKSVKRDITITRVDAGLVAWPTDGDLGADSITVGPDLFKASPEHQIGLLLEALANAVPDVEKAFIPGYVTLAEWIHDNANE